MCTSRAGEINITSSVTKVLSDLEPGGKTDYLETKKMYKKFWTECQECFVWNVDMKYTISIDQMDRILNDWMIWEYEELGMLNTKYYLVNMPDPSIKQTLYVMPDIDVKPQSWEEIATRIFFIFNGQHSVVANKDMQTSSLPKNIVKQFMEWNCFIVWSKDKSRLRQIFGYYNRCNHFSIVKSTWATNVLGARFIWTELGRPTPPKSATKLGRVVRKTKKNAENDAKYATILERHFSNEKYMYKLLLSDSS
jgi:hypothetical protein